MASFDLHEWTTTVKGLAVQADGKLVVACATSAGCMLVRLTANGAGLDESFADNGKALVLAASAKETYVYGSVQTMKDGRIVVRSMRAVKGGDDTSVLARYTPDGRPDPTFGDKGCLVMDAGLARLEAITVLPDGAILGAGWSGKDQRQWTLARITPSGRFDEH